MALDLIRDDGRVVGVLALGRLKGEAVVINASATVLAAGGAGRLFQSPAIRSMSAEAVTRSRFVQARGSATWN